MLLRGQVLIPSQILKCSHLIKNYTKEGNEDSSSKPVEEKKHILNLKVKHKKNN